MTFGFVREILLCCALRFEYQVQSKPVYFILDNMQPKILMMIMITITITITIMIMIMIMIIIVIMTLFQCQFGLYFNANEKTSLEKGSS